mgnify:CR=1 FL=1
MIFKQCEHSETGDFVIGKIHLHNTKVVRSKINEDKAFEQRRYKNHPKGHDMPYFEIRQNVLKCVVVCLNESEYARMSQSASNYA